MDEVAHGALPRLLEVVDRLGGLVGRAPVPGQQRIVRRQIGLIPRLVPLRHRTVQRFLLRRRHHLVRHLLRDDMAETEARLGFGRFADGEILRNQGLQVDLQKRPVVLDRADVAHQSGGERPADHAGDFQRHLLRRGETVDAARDEALHMVWERQRVEIDTRGDLGPAIADPDLARVAEIVGDLLDEKGIAQRLAPQELRQGGGNLRGAESLHHQRQALLGAQRLKDDLVRVRGGQQRGIIAGKRIDHRPGDDHQHQRRHLGGGLPGQRPGGRVHPVAVLQNDLQRRHAGPALEQADQQFVGVEQPHFAEHLRGGRRGREVERQGHVEQGRQFDQIRFVGESGEGLPALLLLARVRIEFEQVPKDRAPNVKRRGAFERKGHADERGDLQFAGPLQQVGDEG